MARGQLLLSTLSREAPFVNADTLVAQGAEEYLILRVFFPINGISISSFYGSEKIVVDI